MRPRPTHALGFTVPLALVAGCLLAFTAPPPPAQATGKLSIPAVKQTQIKDATASGTLLAALPPTDTIAFSMVGVTWERPAAGVRPVVQVKTRAGDGTWSGWTRLEVDDGETQGRGFTDAPFLGTARTGIEVRVLANTGVRIKDIQATLINSDAMNAASARGDGVGNRGDGVGNRGDGVGNRGDGVGNRGDGVGNRGDGVNSKGDGVTWRGDGVSTRGDGVGNRGDGVSTKGDGVGNRGDGVKLRTDLPRTKDGAIDLRNLGDGVGNRGDGVGNTGDGVRAAAAPMPGATSANSTETVTVGGGAGEPVGIISRPGWGADESLVPPDCYGSYNSLQGVIVHHTAGTNSYSPSQSAGIVRGIYYYHAVTLDWCDIGYNFLVDQYGQIFEGRRGSIPGLPHGAHATYANVRSVGISFMGNSSGYAPSENVYNRIAAIIAWKFARYGVSPTGTATYWDYNNNRNVSVPTIAGHRQVSQTECPGANIWANMDTIRRKVASAGGAPYSLTMQAPPDSMYYGQNLRTVASTSPTLNGVMGYMDYQFPGKDPIRFPVSAPDGSGQISALIAMAPGVNRMRFIFFPPGAPELASPWQTVNVLDNEVSITSPASATDRSSYTVTGRVLPSIGGFPVQLTAFPTNTLPQDLATVTTADDGTFSYTVTDPALLTGVVGWRAKLTTFRDFYTPVTAVSFPDAAMPTLAPASPTTAAKPTSQAPAAATPHPAAPTAAPSTTAR